MQADHRPQLSTRIHPARQHPGKTVGLVIFLAALLGLSLQLVAPLTASALAALLLLSLSDYLLPTDYSFTALGVEVRRGPWRHCWAWERFHSYTVDRHGILLSPFRQRHPLESFRGVFLPLPRPEKERTIPWLSQRLPQA